MGLSVLDKQPKALLKNIVLVLREKGLSEQDVRDAVEQALKEAESE